MREIKFRVWDTAMEKFIGSEFIHLNWDGSVVSVFDNGRDVEDWTPNKQAVLQQYTGLKDKNGKEIYEGDFVKSISLSNDHHQRGATVISPIEYWKGNACLSFNYVPLYPFCVTHDIEVIGNIYENGDLLSVSND